MGIGVGQVEGLGWAAVEARFCGIQLTRKKSPATTQV